MLRACPPLSPMNSRFSSLRIKIGAVLVGVSMALQASPALALFHLAHIDEFMVSYGGDPDVQFVEIRMITVGQNIVVGSKLNAFDANGSFIGTLLTVPSNVASGTQRAWLMGTPEFETASGIQADFEFAGGLPTGGGMVCWGKPGANPTPISCPVSGVPYVDCVAYGNYSGPSNNCIGTPTPLDAEGHSLERGTDTHDNFSDFSCADPASPENNAFATASMPATAPCPICGDNTANPGEQCDGTDDSACPTLCQVDCTCPPPVCGNNIIESGEECDGTNPGSCPTGTCDVDCDCPDPVCGNNVVESGEQCDGTSDAACPGECLPPADPLECLCTPGPLDNFLCYKSKGKQENVVTLADAFDTGSHELSAVKRICTPADKNGAGISDDETHLTRLKAKGAHVAQSGIVATNAFGTFSYDTKKVDSLLVPSAKTIFPAAPPGYPILGSVVDHYRCLKAKITKNTTAFDPQVLQIDDQFDDSGIRQVEVKKPSLLCIATNKNGEGILRPNDHLVCYKVKAAPNASQADLQINNQFGPFMTDVTKEAELCVPSTIP